MNIEIGRMVPLGYGKYFRSESIVGFEPLEEGRGPGRRTTVYLEHLPTPLIVSRSEVGFGPLGGADPRRAPRRRRVTGAHMPWRSSEPPPAGIGGEYVQHAVGILIRGTVTSRPPATPSLH